MARRKDIRPSKASQGIAQHQMTRDWEFPPQKLLSWKQDQCSAKDRPALGENGRKIQNGREGKKNCTNMTLGGYVTLREDEIRAEKQKSYVLEEKGQKKLAGPNLR